MTDSACAAPSRTFLISLSDRLRGSLRKTNTVARIGGDEFAVVLEKISSARHVESLDRKILSVVSEPFQIDGLTLNVGASIGISIYPDEAASSERLIDLADPAMYRKNSGRAVHTPCARSRSERIASR